MSLKIKRHWLKFWKIDLEVTLPTVYHLEELSLLSDKKSQIIYDDIRNSLSTYLKNDSNLKMVSKSESCYVIYYTYDIHIDFYEILGLTHDIRMRFWIVDNEILLETDKSVKRELTLNSLGI
jgi:hypothetical protein